VSFSLLRFFWTSKRNEEPSVNAEIWDYILKYDFALIGATTWDYGIIFLLIIKVSE